MAQTKAELLEEAAKLGIEVDSKAKIAEIKALIDNAEVNEATTAIDEEVTDAVAAAEATDKQDQLSEDENTSNTAKAGKRSAKSQREEADKQAKEERKAGNEAESAKPPSQAVKPTRSRLERRAKGYRKSAEQIDADKNYTLEEAIELAKKTSHVKFDATVELHMQLGVDPRQADQNIRDNLVLPAGTGKTVKIAVFTDDAASAKQAGADIAGIDDIVALLDKGSTDFDILIATPNMMPQLGKYARTLGPRGLMPNPKSGTVTTDVNKAVAEAKAGRVEYRVDSTGIVHLSVGKVSFEAPKLLENIQAVLASIRSNKPQSLKGTYLQKAYLTTSMGPSIRLDIANLG